MERTGRLMLAAAIFSCVALAVAVHAAAPPANRPAQQAQPVQRGPVQLMAADLSCTLQVFRDAAGTIAVPPGGSVMSGGGSVSAFVRMQVKNSSAVSKADSFNVTLTSSSGVPLNVMLPAISLAAGGTHAYPLQEFKYGATSAKVTIAGKVDPGNTVKETNETNNTCTFDFNEQTVH